MNSAPEELHAELARLLDELREAQTAIRALSTRVLLDPTAEDEAEPDRRAHLQHRRELLARIASVVLRAVDAGATVAIHSATPDLLAAATASEPPAPPPPVEIQSASEAPVLPEVAAPVEFVDDARANGTTLVAAPPRAPASAIVAPQPLAATAPPDLARLPSSLLPAWARKPPVDVPDERPLDVALLAGILARLGPPATALEPAALLPEVERLAAEILSPLLAEWTRLPKPVQRQIVAMVAARARHVQDRLPPSAPFEFTSPLGRIFSALTRYSSSEQPGFVVGLQRDHEPHGLTWVDDAQTAYDALRDELPVEVTRPKPTPEKALESLRAVLRDGAQPEAIANAVAAALGAGVVSEDARLLDLLAPQADPLATVLASRARFKRLRRALRERLTGDEDGDDDAPEGDIPAGWPCWEATMGKRAVVIGGDLREEARARIERAFRFASLRWITTDQVRGPQQLAQSIAGGSVDLVIVLARFISHKIQEQVIPACKETGVPWVVVEKGYGVTQVRLAIERFLQ